VPPLTASRYIGVHGLHSVTNGVERNYGYDGRSILSVPLAELPLVAAADLGAFIDMCSEIMTAYGLVPVVPKHGKTDKPVLYDIVVEETRFDVQGGGDGVGYDDLVDMFWARGELRCSSSFVDGGSNRSKCRVGRCDLAGGEIGVFDSEEHVWHCPQEADPVAVAASVGESLRTLAQDYLHLVPPPSLPDWRERYVGTGKPKASLHNAKLAPGGDPA
jgi:hypothetical protein